MALTESNYHIPRNDTIASGLPLSWVRDPHEFLPPSPEQNSVAIITIRLNSEGATTAAKQEGIMMDAPPYVESPFTKLFGRIESLKSLQNDWNSYGAAVPNRKARFWARRVLQELVRLNFAPLTVTASSDDGVAIFFRSENKRASIECLNNGEILGVLSEGLSAPEVVSMSQDHLKRAVGAIQTFLTT